MFPKGGCGGGGLLIKYNLSKICYFEPFGTYYLMKAKNNRREFISPIMHLIGLLLKTLKIIKTLKHNSCQRN